MLKTRTTDVREFGGQLFLLPAVCEPLISQTALDKAIVSEIYLRFFCASTYHPRATVLSPLITSTARLAVFGLTNAEIAGRMGVSLNSVKAYLQSAKAKTGVKKRTELT